MEATFEITHSLMVICLVSIIYMSMPATDSNDQEAKRSIITHLVLKVKSMQITKISIYRTAAGLLALLIR